MVLPRKPESKETEAFSLTLERKLRTGPFTNAAAVEGSQESGKKISDTPDQTSKLAPLTSSRKPASATVTAEASGAASPLAHGSGPSKLSSRDSGTEQGEKNEAPLRKPLGGDVRESKASFADYSSSPVPIVKDTKAAGEAREAQPVAQPLLTEKQDVTSGATKEVAIRLQNPSGETINVKLVDQGGQVQVLVRSSDPATATSLRQDLSSLTSNLDRAGWNSDISLPTGTSFEPVAQTRQADHDSQDTPSQRQAEWQQEMPKKRYSSSDAWDEMLTNQTA
jgi:hypothetical protein